MSWGYMPCKYFQPVTTLSNEIMRSCHLYSSRSESDVWPFLQLLFLSFPRKEDNVHTASQTIITR